ncbi:autotransporter outer membrane beta-barrel domain-containing protein [Fusobacterium periodonticum]|uniref:Autotransporter beta-domain protein n=1 Tax=Fusobacterium periodonticum ATCC 33693 TaxID=546275 RepID=D4CUF4_9FUSO|nr:autotransporter outer membrane beta-barrel domain-containing protein [Fusobacterium periodonticum]EFE87105.1 autotransporter beta-domain protein [Fusobacterium periodonticum ATCC 33693]
MKHKILTIIALILLVNQVNAAEKSIYSPRGHYRIPLKSENVETFEGGGYENLLRMVDEYNRQRGINRSYFYKSTNKELRLHDNIDLIPVTQYTGDEEHGNYGTAELDKKNSLTKGYLDLPSIIEKGTEALKQNGNYEDFSYTTKGNKKRFYFGNGNVTNDIIIKGTNEFNKELELQKNAKTDKYLIDGKYESINYSNRNQLGITMDEYYKRIEGKSNDEVRQFLLEKLKEKRPDLNIYEKDGELYTKENGQEWKVYYKVEPVSVERTSTNGQIIKDSEKFEDTVYTNIYVYKPNNDPQNSSGRILYTNKGDIIVEDKLSSNTDMLINTGYNRERSLQDIIDFAKTGENLPADASENEKNVYRYVRDKEDVKAGTMSQSDFDAKWVTPFGPGSTFQNDIQAYMQEKTVKEAELKPLKEKYDEYKRKLKEVENSPEFQSLGYSHGIFNPQFSHWYSQQDIDDFIATHTPEQVQAAKDYYKYKALKNTADDDVLNKEIEIADLEARYGFAKYGPAQNQRWRGKFIQNSHISLTKTGKKIEFRGQGKILGKVDLGEGENELLISEASTGRFGTNIILGPYSSLHGIKILRVGGKSSANEGNASLSGRTSLTLDLDPTKKNDEGHLYQHALKDSDPNIVFIQGNTAIGRTDGITNPMKDRNQFEVELMVSRLSKDSTIDMGRKIHYTYTNRIFGESWDMNIPFISDSIAHSLVDNHKYSKNGNSLLEVKIKNEIKRLDQDENEVYRSIKNANLLSLVQPTLTTTNKKTKFSVKDEKKEESKKLALFDYLIEKKPEDIIKDLSDFNLDKDKEQEAVDKINKLQSSPVILSTKRKLEKLNELHQREEYKNIDLGKFINPFAIDYDITISLANISEVWTDYDEFYQKDLGYRNSEVGKVEEKRIEKRAEESLKRIKSIVDKIDKDTLTNLATQYPEAELGSIISLINDIKALNNTSQEGMRSLYNKVIGLKKNIDKQLAYKENLLEELEKSITLYSGNEQTLYNNLRGIISYTLREEEALQELKELLSQLKDTNIYSKVNKIAKNEISTYTNIPFDINRSLSENKHYTRGGFISNRTVQDNFKGNIYTAYGIYEYKFKDNTSIGFMVGGANTNHKITHTKRSAESTPTDSTIKGTSAYLGSYFNQELISSKINWINGLGLQYGSYKAERHLKNNYQSFDSNGKVKIKGLNTYTGFVISYPIQEDVALQFKGILSYTFLQQGRVKEKNGLTIDVDSKNYNYLDSEVGIGMSKTLYDIDGKSNLTASISGISGLYGYKNDNLKARITGSTSSFEIKGDRVKKDAVKILIDYNVQKATGFNYGLEGTYISNSDENNVKIGIKAGYTF